MLSLIAASGEYSLGAEHGSTVSRHAGFGSCGSRALERKISKGLVALCLGSPKGMVANLQNKVTLSVHNDDGEGSECMSAKVHCSHV